MITVFGSINMDLIATTARLPRPGETVAGHSFTTAAGGKGANQALAARRAGAMVRMAGAVGGDSFAAESLVLLTQAAVNLDFVKVADEPTGTAHIIVADDDGENVIVVVPGANGDVTAADARAAVSQMSAGDVLMLQMEVPPEAVEAALDSARARRVTSVINLAPFTADSARLGAKADIVVTNESEFELFAGRSGFSDAQREAEMRAIHERTGQTIIVTLGADGVIAIRKGSIFRAPGLKIEPIDTVGAGDSFSGYLAAALDAGLPFADCLRRAAVAGSLACTRRGAQPAIPYAAEVDARLGAN
ncbi:ribokinase [Rhizobium sp. TRM96647]|uniref:ribokinase n=1 Tax=unclassified Rhizobium TaxID=2613769 RepID=UPI0021E982BD|nr:MULTISPECIES: ribokinase [unclassified Rhizobium]MCV3736490.1 ribokinase [Rhizobium sp. TRM96647]MCV3758859.1 ribokinase [Rhizobium sp. TRM96650]